MGRRNHGRSAIAIYPSHGMICAHSVVCSMEAKENSNECKRRKIKCNGQTPCQRCGNLNLDCQYAPNCCNNFKESEYVSWIHLKLRKVTDHSTVSSNRCQRISQLSSSKSTISTTISRASEHRWMYKDTATAPPVPLSMAATINRRPCSLLPRDRGQSRSASSLAFTALRRARSTSE
jgi:hypothetical protein